MATGIGPDNTEIAMVECCRVRTNPIFLRMGSCGGLQPWIRPGDLVVSLGAARLENTSSFFVPGGFPAVADPGITEALEASCEALGFSHHLGITATAPGFYGAQGRTTETFRPLDPEGIDALIRAGVANFEMESSVLFSLAGIAGLRAGTVCAVYANRITDEMLDAEGRFRAEGRCLAAAAGAVRLLNERRRRT
jgi:uridine phosphorylase